MLSIFNNNLYFINKQTCVNNNAKTPTISGYHYYKQILRSNYDTVQFTRNINSCTANLSNEIKATKKAPEFLSLEIAEDKLAKTCNDLSDKCDITSISGELGRICLKFNKNDKIFNFIRYLITKSTSPDGNLLIFKDVQDNTGISTYKLFQEYIEEFHKKGFAESIQDRCNTRWKINTKFHELVTGRKVLQSGMLLFDKKAINENELNRIIEIKKLSKVEDNYKIRIEFNKNDWGSIYPILDILSSKNQPAFLVISKSCESKKAIPSAIRILFVDYIDEIGKNELSPEFICSSKIKLEPFHQLIIDQLLEENCLTARKIFKNIGYSHQSQYLKYFEDLQKLEFVSKNKNEYQLTTEFFEKIENSNTTFDMEKIKEKLYLQKIIAELINQYGIELNDNQKKAIEYIKNNCTYSENRLQLKNMYKKGIAKEREFNELVKKLMEKGLVEKHGTGTYTKYYLTGDMLKLLDLKNPENITETNFQNSLLTKLNLTPEKIIERINIKELTIQQKKFLFYLIDHWKFPNIIDINSHIMVKETGTSQSSKDKNFSNLKKIGLITTQGRSKLVKYTFSDQFFNIFTPYERQILEKENIRIISRSDLLTKDNYLNIKIFKELEEKYKIELNDHKKEAIKFIKNYYLSSNKQTIPVENMKTKHGISRINLVELIKDLMNNELVENRGSNNHPSYYLTDKMQDLLKCSGIEKPVINQHYYKINILSEIPDQNVTVSN